MRINQVSLIIILCGALFINTGFAQESRKIYDLAVNAARSGDKDAAFMYLTTLVSSYPDSAYAENALLGLTEYYFSINSYHDAAREVMKLIDKYPESQASPFALCYLLKISRLSQQEELTKKLEKEITTSKHFSFVFRDHKEYLYTSALGRKYRVVYYIDKVEFYIDGELFEKISY